MLLAHYGIRAAAVHTNTDALVQDLDQGRTVIVGLNDKTIWTESGNRTTEDHFVVVTGIDTRAGVAHQQQLCHRDQVKDAAARSR